MFRFGFTARMIALVVAATAAAVAATMALTYARWTDALESRLASELLAVVNSTAPLIDGDLHQMVYAREDRSISGVDEFELIRGQLLEIKDLNRLSGPGSPLYTMRPTPDFDRTGLLEFVVMTDASQDGEYFVGNRYPAEAHNRAALQGLSMASGLYRDTEGAWLSASAPIRDGEGKIVGLIQADRAMEYYDRHVDEEGWAMLRSAAGAVVVIALIFSTLIYWLNRPLERISRAARSIAIGDFSYRIRSRSEGELGELSRTLDVLSERVERFEETLGQAREEAEASAVKKAEMIVTMARWIQTPLRRIVVLSNQLGGSDGAAAGDRARQAATIRDEASSCLALIDDLDPEDPAGPLADARSRSADSLATGETPTARKLERSPSPPLSQTLDSRNLGSSRVLVAEDNETLRNGLVHLLQELGCEVDAVADGRLAITQAGARSYDLVLMDCQMPVMDGFEATRRLRELKPSANPLRVVGLVTNLDESRRRRCLEVGMDDVLAKPVGASALKAALASH